MNTLPAHVKLLIYEYDSTYRDISKNVMDELANKTIIKNQICHKTYIANHLQINGIHRTIHNYLWGLGSSLPWGWCIRP